MIKGIIRSTKLANRLKAREGQGMKRFEIDLSDGKITIRKEREERLTANQRFYIIAPACRMAAGRRVSHRVWVSAGGVCKVEE